jgi:DNA polymerase elongation subunit (family B)
MKTVALDIEVYKDYFLVMLKDEQKTMYYEMYEGHDLNRDALRSVLGKVCVVTFNGNSYDMPLLNAALEGASCYELKDYSDNIIVHDIRPWELDLRAPKGVNHIDLIEVAPGLTGLKNYAGRMGAPKMQDLPIEPSASITPEDRAALREYCANDLDVTLMLFKRLQPQIALREKLGDQYGQDLRSKSDAQIAEAVIKAEVHNVTGKPVGKPRVTIGRVFKYKAPAFIQDSAALDFVRACDFVIADTGSPKCEALDNYRAGTYRMGIGGLHSTESAVSHIAAEGEFLIERDVASYYPSIILQCGLYPETMGKPFLDVYTTIYERRLAAKAAGDKVTADTLKIALNGTFGKLGSRYSCLYSPGLLVQVTLTGQLALLDLIGMVEATGAKVVSANTDGIVIRGKKTQYAAVQEAVSAWEHHTGFVTEEASYIALHSRDVNSYVAIKADGHVKLKGAYATTTLSKSPANEICSIAAVKYLLDATPIRQTIYGCEDITLFATVRAVRTGAIYRGRYLGKVVRWYRGTEGDFIRYKKNGNKVPKSDNAVPIMELPEVLPTDIDYQWYMSEAIKILIDVGLHKLY